VTDPRSILGVGPHASRDEVKAAYRRLAKRYHPDRNPSPDAVERMKEVNAAYQQLMREPVAAASWWTDPGTSTSNETVWDLWVRYRGQTRPEDCPDCSFRIDFGKWRGHPMWEVAQRDLQYLQWISRAWDGAGGQAAVVEAAQAAAAHFVERVHAA
jgi:hypothetical protein